MVHCRQVEALQQELASKAAGLLAAQKEVQDLAITAAERQKRFGLLNSTFRKKEVGDLSPSMHQQLLQLHGRVLF